MSTIAPMPKNEMQRIINLSDYNLDYSSLNDNFKELAKLAAAVTGSATSLVNIIDSYTQWSVASNHGEFIMMPREESVCQWTINETDKLEVKDIGADERFKDRNYVINDVHLNYYYGVPLKTSEGHALGALCVLNHKAIDLSPEKEEILRIIGTEVVNRLNTIKTIESLKSKMQEVNDSKKRVAHDIRGPLAGIIGLASVISEQGTDNEIDEVLEFVNLIHKSGNSLLELADEILSTDTPKTGKPEVAQHQYTQVMLKEKLEKLYCSQAKNKKVHFEVHTDATTEDMPFSKNKLLQIIGNLASNAIKFTPPDGTIKVNLSLQPETTKDNLLIVVSDNGVGMNEAQIQNILSGTSVSSDGTAGEQGYGFGLALVKHLIESLKGTFNITSEQGKGTAFEIVLPQR
ncbi:GAF domain-containing sensor histidine kinase [Mucilaginibacter koreensis]